MNRKQVLELFKFLNSVYPKFMPDAKEEQTYKVDTWTRLLRNQNPAKVMLRAERYALENKFPPTIADLSERITEAHGNDFLKKVEQWRVDANDKR